MLAVANRRRRASGGSDLRSLGNALDADWVQWKLPQLARRHRADLIHHLLPALARSGGRAQGITVHDLAFWHDPGAFDQASGRCCWRPTRGFETAAEQLVARLSARGHEVAVYCRPHVIDRRLGTCRGARLVHLPTIRNKYLDTFVHTFLSAVHAPGRRPVLHRRQFAAVPGHPLAGIPSRINVDGLDSDRRKWPATAKAYLRFAECTAPRRPIGRSPTVTPWPRSSLAGTASASG